MSLSIKRMVTPPHPTMEVFTLRDKTRYCRWSDGSWRRDPARLRGKAQVKAAKRARREQRA